MASLPMWEGDHYFLPMVFDEDNRPFHGHMPYKGEGLLIGHFVGSKDKFFVADMLLRAS